MIEAPEEEVAQEAPAAPSGNLLKTGLRLTPEQVDAMVLRALNRIDDLTAEMGLLDMGQTEYGGWMWEREKNQMQYDNDWSWRVALGGIFEFSNFSLNLSKRYTRLMSAKGIDDLLGTEPFFAAMPMKHGDPMLAKQAEWDLQEKVGQSNTKTGLVDGLKIALIRNEAVLKVSHVTDMTKFHGPAEVAMGPFMYESTPSEQAPDGIYEIPPGEPILTPSGEFIYRKDDIIEDTEVAGLLRLQKDPSVAFRHALEFQHYDDLMQTAIHYEGVDVHPLDYRDFLCPLNAPTVHKADINVHLFDEEHSRLVAQYGMFEVSANYVGAPWMAGEKQPKEGKGETETNNQYLEIVNCADCYMRWDVDGDGIDEEIWVLIDRSAKKAIWFDYLHNHMARRPFDVIPGVERVPNRWYGVGVFEMLDHKQLYVDTQFNRVNFKSSKSGTLRFRVRNAVAQWKAGQEVVFGDDTILDVEDPRFDSRNPPFFQVGAPEIDPFAMELLQLMIQAGSTEVGIVGPDDGAFAGLDTTKLATGIKSLERTGNVLMKLTEGETGTAISAVMDQVVDVILEHMDERELVFYSDGETLLDLNRDEIRKFKKKVKLLLTKTRSTETIENARMVIQLCREYYEAINPFEQFKLRDEYIRQLKSLETPDADTLLDEVPREEAYAWLEQSKQPQPIEPKTSIATKYPDLERTEQIQVLQKEGIQPASDQEIAAGDRQEIGKEVALERGKAEVQATAQIKVDKAKPKPVASSNGSKK